MESEKTSYIKGRHYLQPAQRLRSRRGYFVKAARNYEVILGYASVQKWLGHLNRKTGSQHTRHGYLGILYRFQEFAGKNPDELVKLRKRERGNLVQGYSDRLLNAGRRSQAQHVLVALKSFFKANGVEVTVERVTTIPTMRQYEVIPTREQVYRMADYAASTRNKAIILCLFQSGLRAGTLGNLDYGHVREQLEAGRVPIRLHVVPNIDKKSSLVDYYTFFGVEAADALRAYIAERRERGEDLKDDSPLFVDRASGIQGARMTYSSIFLAVKRTIRRAGLPAEKIWPHCLRKTFRKVLNASDFDEDTKEALMGHRLPGSRGSYFDVHDVDEIAEKYLRCNWSRGPPAQAKLEQVTSEYNRRIEGLEREQEVILRLITEWKDKTASPRAVAFRKAVEGLELKP